MSGASFVPAFSSCLSRSILIGIIWCGLIQLLQAGPSLPVIGTDGKPNTTTVAFTIKNTATGADTTSVAAGTAVSITAVLQPELAHRGQQADMFAVVRQGNSFFMRNLDGVYVAWNGKISALVPAREKVTLSAGMEQAVYSGSYASASTVKIFAGYMLSGTSVLVYTPNAASLVVTEPVVGVNAMTWFGDHVETDIIQTRCIACHVAGGIAKDSAMVLERSSASSLTNNFNTFSKLIASKGSAHVLTKVTGGAGHGGGVQLAAGSTDYSNLATLISLIGGTAVAATPGSDFFSGVVLQPHAETLRRAAIMVAGRAPTAVEIAAVSKGDEATLRTTLKGMLKGEGFHKFLLEGTNDRLLLSGTAGQVIDFAYPQFQDYQQGVYDYAISLKKAGKSLSEISGGSYQWSQVVDAGLRKSPGELIAYIAENDRSYKEVLTADYMMMNPRMNQVFKGGATFSNSNNQDEFRPGKLNAYFLGDDTSRYEKDLELSLFRIVTPSKNQQPWRHAGLLNHPAFLKRYPSTATNRNRARARWTLYHFMDIDIEKSVQRPTDPVALADKDNPTLKNPACAACHERMDPVAATFQNYSDQGFYREYGQDSLDNFYKYPNDGGSTPYQVGDLWYRDMRTPGLLGTPITNQDEALRDLGQLIVKDPAFARASVKFWWPSIMNSEVLLAPTVESDADYQARLMAYQAQALAIEQFATSFSKDFNLKNLLVEMMLSPWFRADTSPPADKRQAYQLADVGTEKLLTPERLQRKTKALTGFNWGYQEFPDQAPRTRLDNDYTGLYGGIDALAVTRRSRDITPLMSTVAQSFALEAACPIVVKEFMLPDLNRMLFGGLTGKETPLLDAVKTVTLDTKSKTDWQLLTLTTTLKAGPRIAGVNMDNPWCEYDGTKCLSQRILYVDYLEIKSPGQTTFQVYEITDEIAKGFSQHCYKDGSSDAVAFDSCVVRIPFNASLAGTYEIRARVAAVQAGNAIVQATLSVQDSADALVSVSAGATAIRQKLVDLHTKLLGRAYAPDAPEINAAYELFVASWQEKSQAAKGDNLFWPRQCDWGLDSDFLDGLNYPGEYRTPSANGHYYEWNWDAIGSFLNERSSDPQYIKQSWVVVISYLLGHYQYLYE